jgi:DNA polymerase III sliding clamp (beta) subunit (PCNA family)
MTDRECCKVTFSFAKNKLTLQAQGAESGRSKVELCLDYTSKPTEIAFNPRLLTEMLRVLPPEESVSLELTDSNSAALFRCGDTYAYIVMPLT